MWPELEEAALEFEHDPAVRVVILRGAGDRAFVSGADISEFRTHDDGGRDRGMLQAIAALSHLSKPLLCAIHGFCIGGGVAISLTADLRYSADDGQFAIPAAKLGVGYPMAGIEMLADLIGPSSTKEIFFTGRRFDAQEALRMGLINAVYPKAQLDEAVLATADQIASNAPLTLRSVKKIVLELGRSPDDRDHEGVDESVRACFASRDFEEGARAFMEKRSPRFEGC